MQRIDRQLVCMLKLEDSTKQNALSNPSDKDIAVSISEVQAAKTAKSKDDSVWIFASSYPIKSGLESIRDAAEHFTLRRWTSVRFTLRGCAQLQQCDAPIVRFPPPKLYGPLP
jgi:hypothetical protein